MSGELINEKENKKIDIRIIRLLANDNSCASDDSFNFIWRSIILMPRTLYSHGDHMAQLGKVTGLLEAQTKIQAEVLKAQKELKILEQKHLIQKIKDAPKEVW